MHSTGTGQRARAFPRACVRAGEPGGGCPRGRVDGRRRGNAGEQILAGRAWLDSNDGCLSIVGCLEGFPWETEFII